jgi:hypothetical protein
MRIHGASSMNPDAIAAVLVECGYREVPNAWSSIKNIARNDKRKARCFRSPNAARFLYLKVKPQDHSAPIVWPVVISPDDCELARASASAEIQFGSDFTFGSMYGRFPKRRRNGDKDEHFGLALSTDDPRALRAFLTAFDRISAAAA